MIMNQTNHFTSTTLFFMPIDFYTNFMSIDFVGTGSNPFGFIGPRVQEALVWGGDLCQCSKLTCPMFLLCFYAFTEHLAHNYVITHMLLAGSRSAWSVSIVLIENTSTLLTWNWTFLLDWMEFNPFHHTTFILKLQWFNSRITGSLPILIIPFDQVTSL